MHWMHWKQKATSLLGALASRRLFPNRRGYEEEPAGRQRSQERAKPAANQEPVMIDPNAHAERFNALHKAKRGFIMPNAWDAGSAIVLAAEGFEAIATTSAGVAFALGKPDYGTDQRLAVSRDEMFD